MLRGLNMNEEFKTHLEDNSLEGLRSVSKSDLHNHFGKGGNIQYIEKITNRKIDMPPTRYESLSHMDEWFRDNIKIYCPYLRRLEAGFVQAENDNITVLAASFGFNGEYTMADMEPEAFIDTMKSYNKQFAPATVFLPEMSLDWGCDTERVYSRIDDILSLNWFKSIDICCNEKEQPISNFKKIFRKAKEYGLRLKAHIGEIGTADDVMEAVEELELDEVHHGIAAASSDFVMKWLAKNKVQLNICPSSNVKLRVVESYSTHPIRKLYDNGIHVTINTDDMLVFNQSVSQEYLNLYNSGLMTAEELDCIRETGLKELDYYSDV